MDDELKAYLDRMREEINERQERLLNGMASLEQTFRNTNGFLGDNANLASRTPKMSPDKA